MTHDADHDPEFEAFLRRRSPMHRRLSQIDHAEPSEELDRVILDRARDAIGTPSQAPMYRKPRWAMPLGLAATILIAFTVVLNIDHRRASTPEQVAMGAHLAEAPATAPVPQLMARARNEEREAGAAGADAAQAVEERAFAQAPALASDSSAAGPRQSELAKRAAKAEAAPVGAASPVDHRVVAAAAAPSPESAEASLPEGTDSAAEIAARRDNTLASSRSLVGPMSGVTSNAAPTAAKAASPPAAAPASAPAADPHASPEAWLAEINRLRIEGKNEDADREMAAFRRAYPTHPGYSLAQPPSR